VIIETGLVLATGYILNSFACFVHTKLKISLPKATSNGYDGVGSWIDEETSLVYLDNVRHVEDLGYALVLARLNGELAIYDPVNKCCIDLPKLM